MVRMKFIWAKGEKTGSFSVTASTVEKCIEVAEKNIHKEGGVIVDSCDLNNESSKALTKCNIKQI